MVLYQITIDRNLSVLRRIGGSEILLTLYHHVQGTILVKRHGTHAFLLLSVFCHSYDAIPGAPYRCIMARLVGNIIHRIAASHLAFIAVCEGTHNQRSHIDADRYPAARKLVALLQMHARDSLVQQILDIEAFREYPPRSG